jgi:Flp pilus assembly protein TadD
VAERPYDPVALNNLGTLHFAVGRIPEALALFEKAARHGPDDANVLTNLGNALLRSGRVDEAEDVLQRAAELDRYFYAPHVNLARVYLTRGDAAAARAELAECARISPNPSSAYAWRHEQAYLDRLEASQQAAGRR